MLKNKKREVSSAASRRQGRRRSPSGPSPGNTAKRTSPAKRLSSTRPRPASRWARCSPPPASRRRCRFVHGSQGCVAYYRSHLSRHFKEPSSAVSSSMTEDAAVFGGLNNMIDGLANTYRRSMIPKMIAVSTTCMAEVIGDDLHSFIEKAKGKGSVPEDFDVPFAHTPAFVGSHVNGYDNMMKGILEHFWKGETARRRRQDQHHPGLRRLLRRQQPRTEAHPRPDGRRIHHPVGRVRRLRHAVRRRVPHV